MIYDRTNERENVSSSDTHLHEPGYAIHSRPASDVFGEIAGYELYTDDGRGNGDFVCFTPEHYWAERIALALDAKE